MILAYSKTPYTQTEAIVLDQRATVNPQASGATLTPLERRSSTGSSLSGRGRHGRLAPLAPLKWSSSAAI